MTRAIKIIITVLAAGCIGGAAWWWSQRSAGAPSKPASGAAENSQSGPVAKVVVTPIVRKTLSEKVIAYGSVIAQPGKSHAVSLPFETRVRHILVAPGQMVAAGEPLVDFQLSAATQLLMKQAEKAVETSKKQLKQTQQRFDLKLATNQELGLAQSAADGAELQLQSLQKEGISETVIRSALAGVVGKVIAQDGQVAAAGSPFVDLVAQDEIEVKLGVEYKDLGALKTGAAIALTAVNNPDGGKVEGVVRLITHRVEVTTRLVDVYVSLPPQTGLFLDGYVKGEIAKQAPNALVVPRTALLPADGGFSLFTIHDGHAVRHIVKAGVETDGEIQIIASQLHEGEDVVTVGNYELEDGMSVEIQGPK